MKLVFLNGRSIEIASNSTIDNIMVVVENFAEVDELRPLFTKENMTKVTMGEEEYLNRIPTGVTVSDGANIVARFSSRTLTQEEIMKNHELQISELQEAVAELLG